MKTILIISVVLSLLVGGGIGYTFGKSANDKTKELQESIVMMKEQSVNIQEMAIMMKSGGLKMQEMGNQYKNDEAVVKGKDLEMFGEKMMGENMITLGKRGNGTYKIGR